MAYLDLLTNFCMHLGEYEGKRISDTRISWENETGLHVFEESMYSICLTSREREILLNDPRCKNTQKSLLE